MFRMLKLLRDILYLFYMLYINRSSYQCTV